MADEVSRERMEERTEGGREGTSYPFAGFYGKTNRRDGSGEWCNGRLATRATKSVTLLDVTLLDSIQCKKYSNRKGLELSTPSKMIGSLFFLLLDKCLMSSWRDRRVVSSESMQRNEKAMEVDVEFSVYKLIWLIKGKKIGTPPSFTTAECNLVI